VRQLRRKRQARQGPAGNTHKASQAGVTSEAELAAKAQEVAQQQAEDELAAKAQAKAEQKAIEIAREAALQKAILEKASLEKAAAKFKELADARTASK